MHGLIGSLINGNCNKFTEEFEYFLDSCPSFLHSVGKDRFFPAFFFGMFATAHDSGVANNDERIFFRFDNDPGSPRRGNLKVAILTTDGNNRRVVRCYTIADRENSCGSRFSQQEREQVEGILQDEELEWQEYKTFIWADNQGEDEEEEAVRCRIFQAGQGPFTGNHASYLTRRHSFQEITRTPGLQNNYLPNLISRLESNDSVVVRNASTRIFRYIISVYDRYDQALDFYGRESDYHGLVSGVLMHFRCRNAANIYLELFVGGGYADITSIVRGTQRLINSVPCVTELKAGRRADRNAGRALEQAGNYVNGCPASSISIPTLSPRAVCAGVNFDFGNPGRLQLGVRAFLAKGSSLVERLFEPVEDEEIGENVRDYLLHPAFGVPAVPGIRNRGGVNARDRRIFLYTSGFAFASIAFAKGTVPIEGNRAIVDKHLFHYDDNAKMLDEQGYNTQVNIGDRALTMVLHVSRGRDQKEEVIVFHVRHVLANQLFPDNGLDLSRWPNAMVHEVVCNLTINRRIRGANDNLGLTVAVETFDSPADYLRDRGNQPFQGELLRIGGVDNVHRAANVMMNTGWANEDPGSHERLYQAISNVLYPLRWVVNRDNAREAGFHAILHGLFYTCDNPARVISEFQVGGGGKLDLVLSRALGRKGGTHPVGKELKFAATGAEVQAREREADDQLADYENRRGFDRVTDGNKIILSYAVLNDQAQAPNTFITSVTHHPHALHVKRNLGNDGINDFPYGH
ncbi:hypothetical protein [Wolbachia endosymbiont (group B) of Schoenobius gigantella]|uniref:hypothetical protein n=1 Tax=Wolbachia endosymbiont (group B) of Schoenobius gigantella TaxID=3139313 RepID=UPI003CCB1A29